MLCKAEERESGIFSCPNCGEVDGKWLLSSPMVSDHADRFMNYKNAAKSDMKEIYRRIGNNLPTSELKSRFG